MSIQSYLAQKQREAQIQHIKDNSEQYCEFAQKYPELYLNKVTKYTLLDEKGNLLESFERIKDTDDYKNTTAVELAKIEVAKAEADYHNELRKQLAERQATKKDA